MRSARNSLTPAAIADRVATASTAAVEKATLLLTGAGMLATELLKWPDPQSPLKGDFQPRKRVAWSEPVPITHVKAIGVFDQRQLDMLREKIEKARKKR